MKIGKLLGRGISRIHGSLGGWSRMMMCTIGVHEYELWHVIDDMHVYLICTACTDRKMSRMVLPEMQGYNGRRRLLRRLRARRAARQPPRRQLEDAYGRTEAEAH